MSTIVVPDEYVRLVEFTPPREEWKLVTPAMARELAAQGEDSDRKIYRAKYLTYGKAMLNGRWRERAAESIHMNDRNKRVNGQHRMLGVLWAAGQNPMFPGIFMRFTYDLTDADTLHIDTGMERSATHRAQMRGNVQGTLFAAIVGRAMNWEDGQRVHGAREMDPEIEDAFVRKNLDALTESVRFGNTLTHNKPKTATGQVYGFSHFLLTQIDKEMAESYLSAIATGLNISAGEPAVVVRNTFLKMRSDKSVSLNGDVMLFYVIAGWNNVMRNRTTKFIRLPWDGRTQKGRVINANFPLPLDTSGQPFVG